MSEDWEARARRAEDALEEAIAERTALWEQLHRRVAQERALDHCRQLVAQLEGSLSWRITAPLRRAKAAAGHSPGLARRGWAALRRGGGG